MIHATSESFDNEISSGKVVVDFWAPWCGPCRMMSEVLEDLEKKHQDVKLIKVNVDDEAELAIKFNISSIPALLYFVDGELTSQTLGYMSLDTLESKLGL